VGLSLIGTSFAVWGGNGKALNASTPKNQDKEESGPEKNRSHLEK
jgi:hypothetical protein